MFFAPKKINLFRADIRLLLSWLLLAMALVFSGGAFSGCGISGYGAGDNDIRLPVYHLVKRGDSLSAISRRYGVPAKSILMLNRLVDGSRLRAGEELLVGYRFSNEKSMAGTRTAKGRGGAKIRQASLKDNQSYDTVSGGIIRWPMESGRVVSNFGPRGSSFHDGIDIAAPEGTPIYAAHSGTVVYAGSKLSGYGKLIILRQTGGFSTVYAHNSVIGVSEGDKVRRGEKIAEVGSTGHVTGPHLHFEVRTLDRWGRYVAVDPLPILTEGEDARPRYRINESLTAILAKIFR